MKASTNVVFKDVDHSPALAYTINRKLEKLERFCSAIIHSRVVINSPSKRHNKAKVFRACIEIGIKGSPILVSQDNESAHVAIREAFCAAERKLKASNRKACDR